MEYEVTLGLIQTEGQALLCAIQEEEEDTTHKQCGQQIIRLLKQLHHP